MINLSKRQVLVNGGTIRDAQFMAQSLLQPEEIITEVEILSEGRSGYWGFFKRPAVLKVTIDSSKTSRSIQKELKQEGLAQIIGGVLKICDPTNGGNKSVVIPGDGAVLRVNGVVIRGSRSINESDDFDVELVQQTEEAKLEVEISSDCLLAKIKITPEINITHKLIDQDKQNVLQLLTNKHREEKKVITFQDVEKALQEHNVSYGIDYSKIQQAVAAADGDWWEVARGLPAQEGKDGYVEYLFQYQPVEITYGEEEWVNYWERYTFPGVREGDVLAALHPPEEGSPGMDITGNEIQPKPVKETYIRVKDGVKISDDGSKAIATTYGRPVLEGHGEQYLKIVRLMIHPNDVDLKSGNLRFDGDLMILGNVTEGMQVTAYGEVTIMGDAAGAVIQAGGRVFCKGKFIHTKVRAGGIKSFYNKIGGLLSELDEMLVWTIREAIRIREYSQHEHKFGEKHVDEIILYLIEHDKGQLESLTSKYASIINKEAIPFPIAIRELMQCVQQLVTTKLHKNKSLFDMVCAIVEKMKDVTKILEALPEEECDIFCSYAQGSILETSCNICVGG